MKNIFTPEVTTEVIARINKLQPDSKPNWGKMSAAQVMAHCCVTYEMVYENHHPKPNALLRIMLKAFVKNAVVSEKPYKKNGQTAPQFLIKEQRVFEDEKNRLIQYIEKTQQLGESHFDGKENLSFGPLNKTQWNNLFYKHLDHHLTQFGV